MAKRKQIQPQVRLYVQIPKSIDDEVDARLSDPLTGGPAYGARSRLVAGLLREWLDGRRGQTIDPNVPILDDSVFS
jgi:hypothetical protein